MFVAFVVFVVVVAVVVFAAHLDEHYVEDSQALEGGASLLDALE